MENIGDIVSKNNSGAFKILDSESREIIENGQKRKRTFFLIEFLDEFKFKKWVSNTDVHRGTVSNPYWKNKWGFYIGEIKGNLKTKAYSVWSKLQDRVFNPINKNNSYKEVNICLEWHCFKNFQIWYNNQIQEYLKIGLSEEEINLLNLELDKDILTNILKLKEKIYSPETCLLIPKSLNLFFRGDSIFCGVSKKGDNYQYVLNLNGLKTSGTYKTFKEAKTVYIKKKREYLIKILDTYKIPIRIKSLLSQYEFLNEGTYFSFIGGSSSGKSTLLKYISNNYQIKTKEVSARKFLDPTKGSYDEQMCDELETKINFYYLQETFKNILRAKEGENIITTRCVIDSLAYTHSLKVAEFLIPQMEEAVELIKDKVIILYTPCDFPMTEVEDKLRGMNEKIRQETDKEFLNLIEKLNIPHYTISGSIKERKEKIDKIMEMYNIRRKNENNS